MEFTGERFIPTLPGDIRLEHLHRYEWCTPYIQGKRVLDIASGEGYGSYALSRHAASVIGVDISAEAVNHARQKYADRDNLTFVEGSAASIPLPDHSIDVVVSFETIEHHDQHEEMMSEIRRVLTPDGLLIISSPNKKIYSDLAGGDHNHFHVKELYFAELDTLIGRYFGNVRYYGQRVTATSLLLPHEAEASDIIQTYTEFNDGVRRAVPMAIEPMYYLAVASNTALPEPAPVTAFFSEQDNAFYEKQREVLELNTEIRRMSDYIAEVSNALSVRDKDLAFIKQELANTSQELASTQQALAAAQATLCARVIRKLRSLLGKS
ncbi:Ubiquinone biosynthesis O-methyltransferase, mitochondrial [Achromobacter deleyi]|uniref:Ubiquinone biosynthesis O-methyltransferase, mitochondrial n=1 Tax=Achromobacter deleyi TaxID=1353891 RepID=A0A6S6ZH11_9BURK|nr:class I SAM-dependent methyltransferase [Achromobacter deleyi]CAB3678447.1 Ubiquinone biosynthesis O-methyltransferase, mitochondrial [Achromobacter deleyi]CAB3827741.1 Ubiquinone biosynthesis O-methyltransferase, mitochondrial [Achromobacter deleyi]CAB3834088.1 Ubiquinone biosynthesis O-methyltransferase, mitochondrial [Achromobacter deleyi]CAB3865216.1 Ubiquinone biosynthesis O-methyltransferase, mitochondrial [Achromobacter deleyi]